MESGKWKVESGKWKAESGKWKVESGKWKVESGKWKAESGKLLLHNVLLEGNVVDVTIADGLIRSVEKSKVEGGTAVEENGFPHSTLPPHQLCPRCHRHLSYFPLTVFPGLCNMHSHAPMTLFRGLGDDQPLDVWLNDYIWPAEQKLTDELVYEGTLQACREMLASGTTAFNDMYFRIPAMAQAVRDSGIRAILGPTFFGDAIECLNGVLLECLSACASNTQTIKQSNNQAIRFSIAPHSIYTVTEKGLRRCADACADLHLPMHIHMSETQKEVDDCLREHGCRPWEWLDKLGILDKLGENIIAAHCLHLSDNEIKLIGDHHITCVHCPNSNLKLGSGYRFLMLELMEAGACVALGTDGSASSNNLDMIEVMKTAALLQKGWRGDPTVVPAEQILKIATLGHSIAPGQPACIFLSTAKSLSDLVYASHGDSVAMTIVDGKIAYRK